MAVTVAVVPAGVVGIVAVLRDDLIEEPSQIAQRPAFVFDGCQCAGGGGTEDRCRPVFESAAGDVTRDLIGDVVNVGVAAGGEGKEEGFYWHWLEIRNPPASGLGKA